MRRYRASAPPRNVDFAAGEMVLRLEGAGILPVAYRHADRTPVMACGIVRAALSRIVEVAEEGAISRK